jgi:serine/threonine-protein kinase
MLTRDGVKVLDFGLAKSAPKPGPSEETVTAVLTTEGTMMGTPQYMAPEQFEGKEADARSDIWAFGAVLYEMVTGQKAFQGKSYSSLLGAILSADPPPMSVKPFTPSWLERLVKRCLQKDPEDRWQSMRDVVIELQTPPQESDAVGPPKASRWFWTVAALAGALALAIVVAGAGWYRATRPAELKPLVRLDVDLGPDVSLGAPTGALAGGAAVIISPDGTRLVYVSKGKLFTRRMDQPKATELMGSEGAYGPFFHPTGSGLHLTHPES